MTDEYPLEPALLAALAAIQARGAIGEASLQGAIDHADQFVTAIPPTAVELIDLGSGGGLPGLVIAVRRPELTITLVERRATRADLLRRAVASLGVGERVAIFAGDVKDLADGRRGTADVVTARSFAAPDITVRWSGILLRSGGRLVVSEPPVDDPARWNAEALARAQLSDQGRHQGVRIFLRR